MSYSPYWTIWSGGLGDNWSLNVRVTLKEKIEVGLRKTYYLTNLFSDLQEMAKEEKKVSALQKFSEFEVEELS